MDTKGRIIIITSIITCIFIQAQGADKYTDGNRPYEFGFSIDGEQHRHEKKDEKGLIQGEFGFITADGVYHVTVYATDEQGRFKILSMKNIRVKPYPTYTAKQTPVRQGHSLELPASPQTSASPGVTTTTFKPISIEPPARSCSHCSIPTTSTPAPINPLINSSPNQIGVTNTPKFAVGVKPQTAFTGEPISSNGPFLQQTNNNPAQTQNSFNKPRYPLEQGLVPPQIPQSVPPQSFVPSNNALPGIPNGPGPTNPLGSTFHQQPQPSVASPGPENFNAADPTLVLGNLPSGRTPKVLDGPSFGKAGPQPNSLKTSSPNDQSAPNIRSKPTLISAQMQIVNKDTDIYKRDPNEKEGLPEGLTKDDMSNLLYTFNYTVGFHGHFEEGYTSGVKQGYYFVTGRNGVRTRIDYVADSKGFHPKITQEVLDLLSDDVPKPESEKEEKYGLKGYEFKWLYYPVEAKGR